MEEAVKATHPLGEAIRGSAYNTCKNRTHLSLTISLKILNLADTQSYRHRTDQIA